MAVSSLPYFHPNVNLFDAFLEKADKKSMLIQGYNNVPFCFPDCVVMCEQSKLPCGKMGGEWKDLFMSQQTNWFYQQMIPYATQSLGLKRSHEVLMGGGS